VKGLQNPWGKGDKMSTWIKQHTPLFIRIATLIVIAVFLGVIRPEFLSVNNLINVLRQSSLIFLLASGLTLVVLSEGIDLSIGQVLAFSACITGWLLKTQPMFVAILGGLAVGSMCGLINGVLIAFLGLPAFVVTYGMMWMAQGAAAMFMKAEIIWGFPKAFRFFGARNVSGIPVPVILMFIIFGILYLILKYTNFGRYIYNIGASYEASRFSGVPIRKTQILAYTLSGFLAAFAGVVYISRINAVEAGIGEPLLLPCLAAITIGGISLYGGEGGIGGTIIGAVIMSLIINGMNFLAIDTYWHQFVIGAIVILSVWMDQLQSKKFQTA
jgi:ribose transport system permease protein